MQPDAPGRTSINRIAGKEITLFFASPIAYLFLGTFAAVSLFTFFWGEAFFARNIADVRPLFEWMPILLVFLSSALTMRLWSEERRTGTLEHVFTQPVPLWHFVVGKFVACLTLLLIALAITLPLPLTVALIGDLDWGPVWAGYVATLLLGAAYLAIGLFISARSDNQIVSMITAAALCGAFFLIGTPTVTDFFAHRAGEWLRLLSTGAHFEAITRGVIDLRDLYYYLSLIIAFLALNTYALEKHRWTAAPQPRHRHWRRLTALLVANAFAANLWLGQIHTLRFDATAGGQYTISPATRNYLAQLQEPLLIRGYFSGKTHPLLAPLVPQLRDLIREYEVVGGGRIRTEFVDPVGHPELEEEANRKYGIEPVPFQMADRYQASIVSSYFNVLVQYGDSHEVLGFGDLLEVKSRSEADLEVQLRNPEYDLTRAIRNVLQSYQAEGNLFDTVQGTLEFTAYSSSPARLPEELTDFRERVNAVLDKYRVQAGERLSVSFVDPDAEGGQVGRQIAEDFGFQAMATDLFSDETFYFYLTLSRDDQVVQIPLGDLSEAEFERNLEAGIKRFAAGFTKTVALVVPEPPPYGNPEAAPPTFANLEQFLGGDFNITREDLSDGAVAGEANILVLAAPLELDDRALFAVDQFLMQGGTVVLATSPYSARFGGGKLTMEQHNSGLQAWLSHHGITVDEQLVLDTQNAALPVPVTRNIGGFELQEIRMLDYPYFIDVRDEGLNRTVAVTADLPQVTMAWASPIALDTEQQTQRQVHELLSSSKNAWLSDALDATPGADSSGNSRTPAGDTESRLLGVAVTGRFNSFFRERGSPLLPAEPAEKDSAGETVEPDEAVGAGDNTVISGVIARSPESARIILFSSNDFASDQLISMASAAAGGQYLNTLQLLVNSVDWSLEDTGLLSIRSRGHFNRTLPPMAQNTKLFWEYLNYGLALIALALVAAIRRYRFKRRQAFHLQQLQPDQANR